MCLLLSPLIMTEASGSGRAPPSPPLSSLSFPPTICGRQHAAPGVAGPRAQRRPTHELAAVARIARSVTRRLRRGADLARATAQSDLTPPPRPAPLPTAA